MNRFYISSADIDKDYFSEIKDDYLADVPSVKYLLNGNKLNFENNVTFLIGENGIGKSTLLEAIAVKFGFPPEGGSKDYFYSTKNSHSAFRNPQPLFGDVLPKRLNTQMPARGSQGTLAQNRICRIASN